MDTIREVKNHPRIAGTRLPAAGVLGVNPSMYDLHALHKCFLVTLRQYLSYQ
jgi:hypothetical protein